MLLDKWFGFYMKGTGRWSRFLHRLKLFYWRRLRHKDVIGFYLGIPIIRSQNLEEEVTQERLKVRRKNEEISNNTR